VVMNMANVWLWVPILVNMYCT